MPEHDKASEKSWFERLSQSLMREPHDREQLVNLLREVANRHVIDNNTLTMLEGVLEVSEIQAGEIMIPRAQMVSLREEAALAEIMPVVIDSGHSRFPVLRQGREEVAGILLAKDLLRFQFAQTNTFDLHEILRPPIFIPTSKRLDSLLREFRQNHQHLAIVIDEYGGVAGIVTIEDVLEQIVGDIGDEYDIEDDEARIKQLSERKFTIKGLTSIEDVNQKFGCQITVDDYDTIGGYVLHAFGHVPKRGEKISLHGLEFEVLSVTQRRIRLIGVNLTSAINVSG